MNTHPHAHTHPPAQRLAPLEPREATARRTPLVPSTGSKSWCRKRKAACACNLEFMHNPWFLWPKALFYVWLEHDGPSWNPVSSLTGSSLGSQRQTSPFLSPFESQEPFPPSTEPDSGKPGRRLTDLRVALQPRCSGLPRASPLS